MLEGMVVDISRKDEANCDVVSGSFAQSTLS